MDTTGKRRASPRTVSEQAGRPRLQRFAYFVPTREDRPLLPFQLRDGDAGAYQLAELLGRGYQYCGPILNYPGTIAQEADCQPSDQWLVDQAREDDLWLISTRIPADDAREGSRRYIACSHSRVEKLLFASVHKHLAYCSRTKVTLADHHARSHPGAAKYHEVEFRQHHGAPISAYRPADSRKWRSPQEGCTLSLAYLVHDRVWPGGPRFFAAFGMTGTDTLIWNYLLATRFPHLIASVPFAMAAIVAPKSLPPRPLTLAFADTWKVRLLTEHPA